MQERLNLPPESHPSLRQCNMAGRTLEQPRAQFGLELRNGPADRRLRDLQPLGCPPEAQRIGDGQEIPRMP